MHPSSPCLLPIYQWTRPADKSFKAATRGKSEWGAQKEGSSKLVFSPETFKVSLQSLKIIVRTTAIMITFYTLSENKVLLTTFLKKLISIFRKIFHLEYLICFSKYWRLKKVGKKKSGQWFRSFHRHLYRQNLEILWCLVMPW